MKPFVSSVYLLMYLIVFIQIDLNAQTGTDQLYWSQFRGSNCCGIAAPGARPPAVFGENDHLLWKISLPAGSSSPVIWGDHIYLTAFIAEKKELQTLCLERGTGKNLWSNSIFPEKFEKSHPVSNPAQSTMAADEDGVYVYFASYGIRSFSHKGELRWDFPLPVQESIAMGHASSPVIMDDKLLLSIDFGDETVRCLIAFKKNSGEVAWKTPVHIRNTSGYQGHCTPVRYQNMAVLHHCGGVCAYSLTDGSPVWWISFRTLGNSTPVIHNHVIYVCAWTNFTQQEQRGKFFDYDTFEKALIDFDTNGDKLISADEIPMDLVFYMRPELLDYQEISGYNITDRSFPVRLAFYGIDQDKSGLADQSEWTRFYNYWKNLTQDLGILALPMGLNGELSMNNIIWMQMKKNPEVPSPVVCNDMVFMVADGGWVTCMDARTGEVTFQEKIGVPGPYLASPIMANGHIYVASHSGNVMVITADKKPAIVSQTKLFGKILATPAIEGDTLYIRTSEHLYAFH